MINTNELDSFPVHALLPKRETTAASFIAKYPAYDGRGVKIAILDTGVDPGAAGLQRTSDGKPKVIDMIDATGAGDVDTSTVVEPNSDGFITGLTGRKLKIPADWKNPTGKYHIGVKNIYELYPDFTQNLLSKEYMEKEFTPKHKSLLTQAIKELNDYNESESKSAATKKASNNNNATSDTNNSVLTETDDFDAFESLENSLKREELQARVDLLKKYDWPERDLGPTYDCVVFHDGEKWRACIDTSSIGDLSSAHLLTNYRDCFQYGTLSSRDKYNYALNIYDDGNLLEIVGQCDSHGTHVAAIAAANHPDDPERNGVAPGAQIVSIIIKDKRLRTMASGKAMVRAFIKVIESGCDLINMSYGELENWSDGRIFDLLNDMIHNHGVIFVSSAGNDGPALSTVIAAHSMQTEAIISVGAYVTPDMMMLGEYSIRPKSAGKAYTWTSRGPSFHGDLGVSICGPGGAITSVPNWSLKRSMLKNGTSMSSPNVCGCIALVLSGLKQSQIGYSPYSVRAAIQNTAFKMPNYDPYSHGHGLIQVEKAYEHLRTYSNESEMERDVHFHVTAGSSPTMLGVYLRESSQVEKPSIHQISIDPQLFNEKNQEQSKKLNFEMNFQLFVRGADGKSASWIECPQFLNLNFDERTFAVKIDPRDLKPGNVYHAMICAYDVKCSEKGPVFQVPITVIKPIIDLENDRLAFEEKTAPTRLKRTFVRVPDHAKVARIRVRNRDASEEGKFFLQCTQIRPQICYRYSEFNKLSEKLTIEAQSDTQFSFAVNGGVTMEIVFGKWWSSLGEIDTEVELTFERVDLVGSTDSMAIIASESVTRFDVCNYGSKSVKIKPKIEFNTLVQSIKPIEVKIQPLIGARDTWHDGKIIYEILLTYQLKVGKATKCLLNFVLLSDSLFESYFESLIWMLFDANKQHIESGGGHPSKIYQKLDKGDYKVLLQVRHDSIAALEKLSELPMQVLHEVEGYFAPAIYGSHYEAITGTEGKRIILPIALQPGIETPLFITIPAAAILKSSPVKNLSAGSYFKGKLSFGSKNRENESLLRLDLFDVKLFVDYDMAATVKKIGISKSTKSSAGSESKEEKDLFEMLLEMLNSPKLSKENKDKLLVELEASDEATKAGKDIRLLCAKLTHLYAQLEEEKSSVSTGFDGKSDSLATTESGGEDIAASTGRTTISCAKYQKLIDLADEILKKVPVDDLVWKSLEKQKNIILAIKGCALCSIALQRKAKSEDINDLLPQIQAIYKRLRFFDIEQTEKNVNAQFLEQHALVFDHFGRYAYLLQKRGSDDSSSNDSSTESGLKQAFERLGWSHLVRHLDRSYHVRFPKAYIRH